MKTTKKFTLSASQSEYIIQLKPKCKLCWLWLLLLLLPLLLLIPLHKDVTFKVLSGYDKSEISALSVNFEYTSRAFYSFENTKFLYRKYPSPQPAFQETTNENGVVIFQHIKYNVYQWLFRKNDSTRTYAQDNCFALDTIIDFFDLKSENIVYTTPALQNYQFTVVDASDNNELLPGATVRIKSDKFGISDSAKSDEGGKVTFKNYPKCVSFEIVGTKYGWFPDSISGNSDDLVHQQDTLFLKQEKEIVKFFVQDFNTKKPLVGAHGQLFFKENPSKQVGTDAITNTNGVAKGVFEQIHKIKEIRIEVNKNKELTYYNDSSTIPVPNYITVNQWNKRADYQKIIYLRPNPHPILFQNINCDTKQGISNIENTITIIKANGTTMPPTKVKSGNNGFFSVSAGMGDKITIVATSNNTCPNQLKTNSITIVNILYDLLKEDESKRKIPLCKLPTQPLQFKNIDKETLDPLAGVKNIVSLNNGKSYTYTSGADGTFIISDVYECQIISIIASKNGYETNNKTIKNQNFDNLRTKTTNDRIIPLKKKDEPEPPRPNCQAFFTGGLIGDDSSGALVIPYHIDNMSEYVGAGEYPDNSKAFPKAVGTTFDGIAIGRGTRVIIYSGKNFTGRVLLDKKGPAIVNNILWKYDPLYSNSNNTTFPDAAVQAEFPVSVREWSKEDMQKWSYGSLKVICD